MHSFLNLIPVKKTKKKIPQNDDKNFPEVTISFPFQNGEQKNFKTDKKHLTSFFLFFRINQA